MSDNWDETEDIFVNGKLEVKQNINMIDRETQIYSNDPYLFDFDTEVKSVLEAIIGRTLEQGMTEVQNEEEIRRAMLQKY